MIVVDTSALAAILFGEDESARFIDILFEQDRAMIAAPTVLELAMVYEGRRIGGSPEDIDELLREARITVIAWDARHATLAREAFLRFGKGRHAAGLNFGDCMSYALARSLGAPLLFKGGDFALTDIVPAL